MKFTLPHKQVMLLSDGQPNEFAWASMAVMQVFCAEISPMSRIMGATYPASHTPHGGRLLISVRFCATDSPAKSAAPMTTRKLLIWMFTLKRMKDCELILHSERDAGSKCR